MLYCRKLVYLLGRGKVGLVGFETWGSRRVVVWACHDTSLSITAAVLITDHVRGRQHADAASGASRLCGLLSVETPTSSDIVKLVLIAACPVCVLVSAFETRPTD